MLANTSSVYEDCRGCRVGLRQSSRAGNIDGLPEEYLVEVDGHQRLDSSAIENMVIIMHYILT
jgi:hypothetical protein